MLQKIVNGIAITSGVVSLAVVGTVGYVLYGRMRSSKTLKAR